MFQSELQEFFGAQVIVQFREGVVLAKGTNKEITSPIIGADGDPKTGPNGILGRKQIVPEIPDEEGKRFTLVLTGTLMPARDGRRVYVAYEAGDFIAKLSIRPKDIYSVSVIEGRAPGSNIVQP